MRSSTRDHHGFFSRLGIIAVTVAFFSITAAGQSAAAVSEVPGRARYVFMFIGDGLGLQQISAAEIYLASVQAAAAPGTVKLRLSTLQDQGLCTTYSANSFITDSAPAATALATGYKTDNGVIGVDPSHTRQFATLAEEAKKAGMRVGIVSTVSLNHATPAAFYAHVSSRGRYYEIGLQLLDSRFDYFAGGGLHKHAGPAASGAAAPSLYDLARERGFQVLRDKPSILGASPDKGPILAVNPTLDADSAMPYAIDSTPDDVSLAEFVRKGIEVLDNDAGFFMMVEGGKIDWACHANDAATSIHDTLAFDAAVAEALAFAAQRPGETLILVTGDHETGGMGLGFAGTEYATFFEKIAHQKESYLAFDRKIAALRQARGTQAVLDDIREDITARFGLLFLPDREVESLRQRAPGDSAARARLGLVLTPAEHAQLEQALARSMAGNSVTASDTQDFLLYGGYEPLSIQITHILNNKAGIGWTSYAHTGIPVPVFAAGPGSEVFRGYYDNTDIARKTFALMGLETPAPTPFTGAR